MNLIEKTRKEIFSKVVEAEDSGEDSKSARSRLAGEYAIDAADMRKILDEGIENNWPPLEPCDDET